MGFGKTVLATLALLACVLAFGFLFGGHDTATAVQDASVMVMVTDGTGSGVVFKNGDTDFVWTAAHVVVGQQQVTTVIDPGTGRPRVDITYLDVLATRPVTEGGRKVGSLTYLAKI